MPLLVVLGLRQASVVGWESIRTLQYENLERAAKGRMLAQLLAAVVAAGILLPLLHPVAIITWLTLVVVTNWLYVDVTRRLATDALYRLGPNQLREAIVVLMTNALAWGPLLIALHPVLDPEAQFKVCMIIAILMTASALMLPSLPVSTLIFSIFGGLGPILAFVLMGHPDMALSAVCFIAVICLGTITTTRRYLIAKMAEAGMIEKDQVVSLLLREFEEGDADWLWQTDTTRRICNASNRFAFALGKEAHEVDGQLLLQLLAGSTWQHGRMAPSLHELAELLKRRESFSNLLVHVEICGHPRWWELSGTPRLDAAGDFEGFRGVGSDVTAARESSEKIAWLARYDTLTGLPNRTMLHDTLASALATSGGRRPHCAFLMIDLDRFKAVNDSLGHHVGDQLLARVSERLKQQMTENELCGRLGGDEFAVVIREAPDMAYVEGVARRIIAEISQPYVVDQHTLFVGASIGSAVGPRDGSSVEKIMRNADLALYRAKDLGGNAHCTYEPALHAHAEERLKLESALRGALEREEFTLAFQPVVDAKDEAVISFEALLRWNSPEHGAVSPAKFVPVAEDTRLIIPIGSWVLRHACMAAVHWPSHVKVAVNVSGEQLLDPGFPASVVSALANSGLSANRLELEVTESIFLRDPTMARNALEQMMALGCAVALDDFGTGYSSLGYLRKLRFSTIKIDRTFVQGAAAASPESMAIIRAVVAMADSLDMTTTAEGVETEQELEIVRSLGCRKIQGYLFGRPMSEGDAQAIFRNVQISGQNVA